MSSKRRPAQRPPSRPPSQSPSPEPVNLEDIDLSRDVPFDTIVDVRTLLHFASSQTKFEQNARYLQSEAMSLTNKVATLEQRLEEAEARNGSQTRKQGKRAKGARSEEKEDEDGGEDDTDVVRSASKQFTMMSYLFLLSLKETQEIAAHEPSDNDEPLDCTLFNSSSELRRGILSRELRDIFPPAFHDQFESLADRVSALCLLHFLTLNYSQIYHYNTDLRATFAQQVRHTSVVPIFGDLDSFVSNDVRLRR
jgi:hypothetical protein